MSTDVSVLLMHNFVDNCSLFLLYFYEVDDILLQMTALETSEDEKSVVAVSFLLSLILPK